MPEDLRSDDAYFKAIQASHIAEAARDRAHLRQIAASNPVSRLVSGLMVRYKDAQFYDSEEHVGLIEELRALDEARHTSE